LKIISSLFFLLMLLTSSQISAAEPDSMLHRIISLSPSVTEVLFELGLGDKVVGVTRYCDYPEQAETITKVGGYFDPNYEVILSLKPDLVILLDEHEQARNNFSSFGIEVLAVNHKTISGIVESLTLIGDKCGAALEAKQVLSGIQARLTRVKTSVQGLATPKIVISIGRSWGTQSIGQLHLVGLDGFFSEIITCAGGRNAYVGDIPFPEVSKEGLLSLDPDMIIDLVPDMEKRGFKADQLLADWNSFAMLRAVKEQKVTIFGEGFMVIPGPRFISIIEAMAKVLHPEIDQGGKP